MNKPLGRSIVSITSPIGSGRAAICLKPSAIPSILLLSSRSLSSSPGCIPFSFPLFRSFSFSSIIRLLLQTNASATASRALSLDSVLNFCSSYFATAAFFPSISSISIYLHSPFQLPSEKLIPLLNESSHLP